MARPRRSPEPPADAAAAPRIIGGSMRGRKLAYVPAAAAPGGGPPRTRPMKDRVRETLFDLLGPTVKGATAIDLFAGTGALGFEAVSRGAARVVFCERHFPTADALRRSAADLGVADRVEVRPGDALAWARRLPPLPGDAPWVVFISPPWEFFTTRHEDLLALLAALRTAAPPASTFVVEADTGFDPARLPDAAAWQSRAVAPAVLHILPGLLS
jgi:16S rRNA (guanine966-N2)-methyltransferase